MLKFDGITYKVRLWEDLVLAAQELEVDHPIKGSQQWVQAEVQGSKRR